MTVCTDKPVIQDTLNADLHGAIFADDFHEIKLPMAMVVVGF